MKNFKPIAMIMSGAMALSVLPTVSAHAFPTNIGHSAVETSTNGKLLDVRSRYHDRSQRHHRFQRRGGHAYLNGRRGYRHHRRGYREYNGFWFPTAAFALGALITGSIDNDRPRVYREYRGRLGPRHYRWCDSRYKTYRRSDNTYIPRVGVRAYCNSPYDGV